MSKRKYKTNREKGLAHQQDCKKYEKTFNGLLMRTYRNMKSRVAGIQKAKAHLYAGLELLPKEEFYTWSKNNINYQLLHETWITSNYSRALTPSIDRIDNAQGYVIGNIRWITHSENSRLGSLSRFSNQTSTLTYKQSS